MSGRPRKISEDGAAQIRAWAAARRALGTPKQMRDRFGICSRTLSNIARGITHNKKSRCG